MTSEATILAHAKKTARAFGLRPVRLAFMRGVESGWPDLMILGPFGCVLFMETKRLGKPLTPVQAARRREIVEVYGHAYAKPDGREAVDRVLESFAEYCARKGGVQREL